MTETVSMRQLVKEFPNGVRAVNSVSMNIHEGEFFALLGPSGCGKTTLLRLIAGLEQLTGGSLEINGDDMTEVEPGDRGVAMVFQDYALFPHMNISDNISYPLKVRRASREVRREAAETTGKRLSLEHLLERRPTQLSGGQQQRVALARAIATRPDVLLLDEPLSTLDARVRLEARSFLKELQRELGLTSVFVTHDQAEALALADRIAVMKDGKIQQVGTPREVFHSPENAFVASFIGSHPMNLNAGTLKVENGVTMLDAFGIHIPLAASVISIDVPGSDPRPVIWGIRPEYVTWSQTETPGALRARIATVENLGASALLTARCGDDRFQAVVPESPLPHVDQECWFAFPVSKVLVFDPQTGHRIGGGDQ